MQAKEQAQTALHDVKRQTKEHAKELEAKNADLASQVSALLCLFELQLPERETSFDCVPESAGCSIQCGEGLPPAAVRACKIRGGGHPSVQVLSRSRGRGEGCHLPLTASPSSSESGSRCNIHVP